MMDEKVPEWTALVELVPEPVEEPVHGPPVWRGDLAFSTSSTEMLVRPLPGLIVTEPNVPPGHAYLLHRKAIR